MSSGPMREGEPTQGERKYTRAQPGTKTGNAVRQVLTKDAGAAKTRVAKPQQKKKLVQIYFKTANNKVTCPECNMSYMPHLKSDAALHDKFHPRALRGREWTSESWGSALYSIHVNTESGEKLCQLVEVDAGNKTAVRATLDMLELVNTELQAPDDNGAWMRGKESGKVFVCVLDKRAIGVISLERIHSGEWLILETGKVVPNQTVPLVCGISRVYVARKYRRCHIGAELLNCAMKHFVYGAELKKKEIGWSQPSEFGSKLAMSFNSVRHKSGYHLLPVYVE